MTSQLFARHALLPDGWGSNVLIDLGRDGTIDAVTTDQNDPPVNAERVAGTLLPGVANCHSHAFQRLMAGLFENRASASGDFWGWREGMYRVVEQLEPEVLHAVAAQLYVEMLKAGYTGVAEFHYLHHQADGQAYGEPAEMSMRILAAAREAGIRLTHLPVFYAHSDFGGAPALDGQRRFLHDVDSYSELLETLQRLCEGLRATRLGLALHSLRAVTESEINLVLGAATSLGIDGPVHLHIAEQQREVDGCKAWSGQRPVEWLMQRFAVDRRWTLVHATHLGAQETSDLAKSGAQVGLCPTTEANLGDGIFAAIPYMQKNGSWAIGSDSHVSVDLVAELRLLEYGQRLLLRKRGILADATYPAGGEYLYREAATGGAASLGSNGGTIATGCNADFVVLDENDPVLIGRQGAALLNTWIFAAQRPVVRDVMVDGKWKVRNGHHIDEEQIFETFKRNQLNLAA